MKKHLEEKKGLWEQELPGVIWAHRTTPRRSTGESPFSLTYGCEAVLPVEAMVQTERITRGDDPDNEELMTDSLDLIEEKRDVSAAHLAAYHQTIKKAFDKKVRPRSFQPGDLVLRKTPPGARNPNHGKLGPNWDGPFIVHSSTGTGAYYLKNQEGDVLSKTWNAVNLKRFYP
jgi:hypothetical protein